MPVQSPAGAALPPAELARDVCEALPIGSEPPFAVRASQPGPGLHELCHPHVR